MKPPIWQFCVTLLVLIAPLAQGLSCLKECKTCTETLVECPAFNLRANNNHLDVRCSGWSGYNFGDFNPNDTIGLRLFAKLTFANCAIPADRPLADMLSFLGPLTNVTHLFFVNNGKNTHSAPLSPVLFEGMGSLTILSLKYATHHPITAADLFVHLPQLEWLDLREYGGRTVPAGLLRPLQALKTLEIRQNLMLEELPPGLLADLPQLAMVIIFGNRLTRLERFTGTPRLAHVDLSGNELAELPVDMFTELPELTVLQLTRNRFTEFPEGLLRRNTALQQFDASNQKGTGLSALLAGLFDGLTRLTELDLSRNGLRELPDTLLHDQRDLSVLKLSNNNLTSLSKQLLQNQKALKELYLDHNQLRVIDLNAFNGQEQALQKLQLSHNNISLHEQGVDVIYLEGRAARAQQTPFHILTRLVELDLSHNAIVKLFVDFSLFIPTLVRLNLSHNAIARLDYDQLHFASNRIERLDLTGNQIREIKFPNTAQKNERLPAKIVLNDNPLRCDCDVHGFVHYVQRAAAEASGFSTSSSERFVIDRLECASPPELEQSPVRDLSPMVLTCELSSDFCPTECFCQKRPEDLTMVVDCANRNLTTVPKLTAPATIDYHHLELLLQGNHLDKLPNVVPSSGNDSTDSGWSAVHRLNVSNNQLTSLVSSNLPPQLELLDVSDNRLDAIGTELAQNLADRTQGHLRYISLAGNPWACECDANLLLFAQDNVRHIADFRSLRCASGQPITSGTLGDLCSARSQLIVVFCATIASVACLAFLFAFLYYRYQHEVKVWMFTHNVLQWLTSEEELDRDKQYDAFVSYSHKDEEFITKHLVPTLERQPMNFRVCWHVRDFMPGEMISAQITKAVEASRRTIIVLSANYLESVWGQMEFKTAYLQSIEDKRNRVIAVIYDDIGNVEDLDQELRAYLKTNTYLRWGDPWFWDKLRYAMPHPCQVKGAQATNNMRMASMDKLNLLKPVMNSEGVTTNGGIDDVSPTESTPPIQQVSKGDTGTGNPLAKLYTAPAPATLPFTISNGKLDLHMPE